MHHELNYLKTPRFWLGLASMCLLACGSQEGDGGAGTGGASHTGGTGGSSTSTTGTTSSGSTGGSGSANSTGTGGSSTGGTGGSGGATSAGGAGAFSETGGSGGSSSSGTGGGGGLGTGGNTSDGGVIGTGGSAPRDGGGDGSTSRDSGGTGGSNTVEAGSGDGPLFGSGKERSLGYVGCSMSQNVAQGYATLGGKRLWPVMGAYGAQVVQNWKTEGGPWTAAEGFDSAVQQYGQPTDVWIMLCIFSNMVTLDEAKQIITLAKKHAPNAKLYITGQPLNTGTDCNLAGNGGAALTDSIAKQAAQDASLNVTYAGTFGPLTVAQRSDGCHANADGQKLLGQQVIDKWGK